MKNKFDILQLWFLASCSASFFTIIGSVSFVIGLGHLFSIRELRYFHGFEAFGVGFIIAGLASALACGLFLLPWVFVKIAETQNHDMKNAPVVTGAPSIVVAVLLVLTGEPILILMAAAALVFGHLGGWIFGRTYEFLYNRMLDSRNTGFFENSSSNFFVQK